MTFKIMFVASTANFLVYDCLDTLLLSVTELNCSLFEGGVPDGLLKAVVTPLIKKA